MGRLKPQKEVIRQTARVAAGVFILVAVMLVIYAIVGKFSAKVALGGLYTGAVAVLNFFIMGLTVQTIAETAAEKVRTDEEIENLKKRMKAKMQLSYSYRMVFMFGLVIIGIAVLGLDPLATILPLVFPRIVITVMNLKNSVSPKGSAKE